jgi:hypothetical protein
VVVIGGGASAVDLGGLLADTGAAVQLVARQGSLKFHGAPPLDSVRSRWQRIRHPQSGIGPGVRARFLRPLREFSTIFQKVSACASLEIFSARRGGWFSKEKVIGRMPLLLGYSPSHAEARNGKLQLHLRSMDGSALTIGADHVIAATGYRVDVARLPFLSARIRSRLRTVERTPVLNSAFESSVPGLYFIGLAAANSFGPVMRFAFGAEFAARRITAALVQGSQNNVLHNGVSGWGLSGIARLRAMCQVAR